MTFLNESMGRFIDLIYENRIPENRQLLVRIIHRFKERHAENTKSLSHSHVIESFFKWYAHRFEKEFAEEVQPRLDYLTKNLHIYLHFSPKERQHTS